MSVIETRLESSSVTRVSPPWVECPLPHLLDTSVVFNELAVIATCSQPTHLLASAQAGSAILYVSANVAEEIPKKFEKIAAATGAAPASVEDAWWQAYSPHVRIVDARPATGDPRRIDLAEVDRDDLPFADAVALMGPVLALSEDKHLADHGLATSQWREVPELTLRLSGTDLTLKITPELTALAIGEAIRLARRHPRIATALLLAVAYAVGPRGPQALRLNLERARSIALQILRIFAHLLEAHNEASCQVAARLIRGSGEDATRAVVSILARRRQPVAEGSLLEQINGIEPAELSEILVSCPAIMETAEGWQLGRAVERP